MNRIDRLFKEKQENILSVYFTAGYPELNSTTTIIKALEESGADMIEIGIPFSDPMADGPVIQHSNELALKNGMSLKLLFSQLSDIRKKVDLPVLLMGYLNPVVQFGIEKFCRRCNETGIDGVILPDLPPEVYLEEYQSLFESYNIYNVLLITPQTDNARIRFLDTISRGFIYMVSSSSVTGTRGSLSEDQREYFERVRDLSLINPSLVGFGISDHLAFDGVCRYAAGGIIGSAFVKIIGEGAELSEKISKFIKEIRGT